MSYNDIKYLYQAIQIKAMDSVLDPDDTYNYRRICRWYSKTFHTPLTEVYNLDYEHVLSNYYESTFEDIPYNDLYDIAIEDFVPDLADKMDEEADEYAKALEAEQARTLARKAKINKSNNDLAQATTNLKNLNKTQSLDNKASSDQSPQPEEINLTFEDETLE